MCVNIEWIERVRGIEPFPQSLRLNIYTYNLHLISSTNILTCHELFVFTRPLMTLIQLSKSSLFALKIFSITLQQANYTVITVVADELSVIYVANN